ncbi:MAG: hypothetical protein ABJA57_06380 [Ginsengibacter sp.]
MIQGRQAFLSDSVLGYLIGAGKPVPRWNKYKKSKDINFSASSEEGGYRGIISWHL